jgi:hypothetical protein
MPTTTGPSNTGPNPVVTLGPVSAPVVRTAGQGGVAWVVMEAMEAYSIYEFSDRQWAITLLAGTTFVSWLQNQIEAIRGRRLIGAPR